VALENLSIFTTAMNAAFINAYQIAYEAPPVEQALTVVPSTGRAENYPWLFPPPMMREWQGYRQFAKLGTSNYQVKNLTYTSEFELQVEELDDAQVPGFKLQAAGMAEGAKMYKYIQTQIALAAGQTTTVFDGINFFATTRATGITQVANNNIVTGTAASSDGVTHCMVVMITANRMVKPLLWQNREEASLETNVGSMESREVRKAKWFATMRGAAAFGFPHDAILVKFANTPTVAEVQTTLGTVNARFRQFVAPKNTAGEANQYIHGQTKFTDKNVLILCSSLIEHIVRQALTLTLIGASENYFKNWASLAPSGYLDAVV
jgi:phage major head subunit gpT-like protein